MSTQCPSVPLREACNIKPPKKEARERLDKTDMVSFVPMNDLGVRQKSLVPKQEKQFRTVSSSYTYFAEGDVLLAKITPCFENGKLGIARDLTNGVGFGSSEFFVLRPKKCLKPEYLFYYLSQNTFRDAGRAVMSGAVGHKRVPKEFIENHALPLPTVSEQERIVAILDEAFAGIDTAIANTEKNLASAWALFESYQESVFRAFIATCSEVALSTHTRFIDYRGRTPRKTTSGLRLITAKNVRMGFLQKTPEEFVEPETYDAWMRRGIPDRGDVLFTTEAPLGFVCQLDTSDKVVLAQRIITIQPDRDTLDPVYLKYALMSPPIQKRIHEQATGATATGIKSSLLKKISIPLPEITEQRVVAEMLEQLERGCYQLASLCEKKKQLLLELKQSLLQKAFMGELTADRTETEAREATA